LRITRRGRRSQLSHTAANAGWHLSMAEQSQQFLSLLEAARGGDAASLAELVRLYEPQLRVVARARLGPALRPYLDSVDLVQSVHRSLLVGLRQDKFDISTPQNLIGLALTLVRRKVARHWRRLQRQQRIETGTEPNQLAERLQTLSNSGDDPARAAEFNDALRHVCMLLDATERRVIALRLQGFSIAEVARSMEIEPHLLRVRLGRLRQRLHSLGVLNDWL
jgi:RNA polymerase sigma factor (sigma-70 family)